jgi:spermidine synthase
VRGLVMADGTLWMSDVPQERLMMLNNAQASRGRVLVGGLGLGLYPQYALPYVESLRIVERETAVCRLVEPIVRVAAAPHGVELAVEVDDVEAVLCAPSTARYDTIFLDIWDKLDAAHLPAINLLRDRALAHLTPGGRVLLWGYCWMVRLFEQACERLLSVDPAARSHWLEDMTAERPAVRALLLPIVERFAERPVDDRGAALGWCREYAVRVTPG